MKLWIFFLDKCDQLSDGDVINQMMVQRNWQEENKTIL